MQLRRDNRSAPFVLMLGAGASLKSGVPPTWEILQKLVDKYAPGLPGDLNARFDKLWKDSSGDVRAMLLKPFVDHLDLKPSPGYAALARLVQAGYFDLLVSFNFDELVEQSLRAAEFKDFKVILRGETESAEIPRLVRKPVARFTLLKLHGGVRSTDRFLFSYEEMANYQPKDISDLVTEITSRPIIVCGYGFADRCVIKTFCDTGEEAVYCVNPSGAPPGLRSIQATRKSSERVIDGTLGQFDDFFEALEQELFTPVRQEPQRPKLNPFKFLDSYDLSDQNWFFGRSRLIRRMSAKLAGNPESLHLIGDEKVGKTSFVRAGLLARLNPDAYELHYQRCRRELERQLRELGAKQSQRDPAELTTLAEGLDALAPRDASRRVILVLDQFERVLQEYSRNDRGWQQLAQLFRALCNHGLPWLTVIFVSVDPKGLYYTLIVKSQLNFDPDVVKPLPPRAVAAIVNRAARRSGFSFDPEVVRALVKKLADPKLTFTLAHLQAICHLLVRSGSLDEEKYRQHITRNLEEDLDKAINASDFLNCVEDLPLPEGRDLLRSLMKVVSEPSKERIASFLKARLADILQRTAFPEPL